MNPISIYIHVPFCTVKCSYCAFNVYTHLEHLVSPYVDALCKEIEITGATNPGHRVHTIYFGGGTPTLLTPKQYQRVLDTIRQHYQLVDNAEISTEANPDDLQAFDYLDGLRQVGIQRLSIGVQSVHQSELNLFGRLHSTKMIETAVSHARRAGFKSVNLDLIYGNPDQTMQMWEQTLDTAIALSPDHFSLYALGVEPKTALEYWIENGKVPEPDDDLAADMYELASEKLVAHGYHQYELSNWSRSGHESQHNIQYWRNLPYLGLGPGAHGYAAGVRYVVEPSPHRYIKRLSSAGFSGDFPLTPATKEHHIVSREDEITETIMMGLRLIQRGIRVSELQQRFGENPLASKSSVINQYEKMGLLVQSGDTLRFTPAGRFVSNHILADLI